MKLREYLDSRIKQLKDYLGDPECSDPIKIHSKLIAYTEVKSAKKAIFTMTNTKAEFYKWAATYGDSKEDADKAMYSKEMMIEFCESVLGE